MPDPHTVGNCMETPQSCPDEATCWAAAGLPHTESWGLSRPAKTTKSSLQAASAKTLGTFQGALLSSSVLPWGHQLREEQGRASAVYIGSSHACRQGNTCPISLAHFLSHPFISNSFSLLWKIILILPAVKGSLKKASKSRAVLNGAE